MRDEGRELSRVLDQLITSEPYRNGTISQARAMARNRGQVREIVDALKREMIADVIRGTRRDLTAERTRLTAARMPRRRLSGAPN